MQGNRESVQERPVKLVVGLGNPGPEYADTRHNAGFRITQRFAQASGIALGAERFHGRFGQGTLRESGKPGIDVAVLQPETFMNRSGRAVAAALRDLEIQDCERDIVVVIDDVDLPFGRLRVRASGGAGGHRGLSDIVACLADLDVVSIPRLRFGVGRPEAGGDTAAHVLEPFSALEELQLPAQLQRASEALEIALREGIPAAMTRFNRDPEVAPEGENSGG